MNNLIAMALFSLTMSITPGPVNIVTLNSGLRYGFRQTFAYVSGATLGFTSLLATLGFGFSQVVLTYPKYLHYVSIIGVAYMAYMAYKMLRIDRGINTNANVQNVPGFLDGATMQLTNPKAWMACIAGVTAFSSSISINPMLNFVLIYFVICYICIALWAFAGDKLKRLIQRETHAIYFTRVMGALLLVTDRKSVV